MQFFSTPRTARPTTPPPAVVAAASAPAEETQTQPDGCGWFDSSFDLGAGLDVTEQDSDLNYMLWKMSFN